MSNPRDAGSVEVDDIRLFNFTFSNELSIRHLCQSFEIFESIENHTLQANFYIAEGIELMNNFPIGGEEFINVVFRTPGRRAISTMFLVESIEGLRTNTQSNLKVYRLRCVTRDYLTNSYTVYTKRYKDQRYDDAIQQVITQDLGSGVPITVESTKGKFDYVVNNVRPFQVVDLITERAVSQQFKSSKFYFFEDVDQYHFITLEKLISDRKGNASNYQFFLDTSNRAEDYEKVINARNILAYQAASQGSAIDKIKRGAMYSQVREFDIATGTYFFLEEYKNPSDYSQFVATDDKIDFNSGAFNSEVTKLPGSTMIVVKDGLRPDMKHNQSVPWKRAFTDRVLQYGVQIRVYGDSDLRVGDVVQLLIPDISGVTKQPEQQEIYSENYIVRELKHHVEGRDSGEFDYFMTLDLRKPNLFGKPIG